MMPVDRGDPLVAVEDAVDRGRRRDHDQVGVDRLDLVDHPVLEVGAVGERLVGVERGDRDVRGGALRLHEVVRRPVAGVDDPAEGRDPGPGVRVADHHDGPVAVAVRAQLADVLLVVAVADVGDRVAQVEQVGGEVARHRALVLGGGDRRAHQRLGVVVQAVDRGAGDRDRRGVAVLAALVAGPPPGAGRGGDHEDGAGRVEHQRAPPEQLVRGPAGAERHLDEAVGVRRERDHHEDGEALLERRHRPVEGDRRQDEARASATGRASRTSRR